MSRRLGQGVVTGLDRSFISTVATYFELPVMLMSSFFSDSIKYDDGFLDFVLVVFDYRKKAILRWSDQRGEKPIDQFNLAMLKVERTTLLKLDDPMVFSLSDS